MNLDELKQCRVGKDRERPSVVYQHHAIPEGSLTCRNCGWVDLPDDMRAKLDAKARENAEAQKRREAR